MGVSFSAYADHDLNNLGHDQTLLYNKVLLNEGNAYSVHTGAFTCPTSGVYLFSFFIGARGQMQLNGNLLVNSSNKMDAVTEGTHAAMDTQGGNVAILRLNQGDVARVVAHVGSHVEGSPNGRLSSFSGVLLYT